MIPKIIWQTHESPYDELPELYKTNSQTYKELDGWEYRYSSAADREAFIAEHFPQYLHLYQHIVPGIFKADFWRYLVLYKHGGFYVDMDSRLFYEEKDHFAKTINDPYATFNVVTAENTSFNNWIILCSKENPIMKDVVETMTSKCQEFYSEGYKIFPHGRWLEATGPAFYSTIINKHLEDISYIYWHKDEAYNLGAIHTGIYKHEMDEGEIDHPGER
jgi:mannosyltransferase OCH1-like enzyme